MFAARFARGKVMPPHSINPGYALATSVLISLCPTPPTSSGGMITVHWSYTHTRGLDLALFFIVNFTMTRNVLTLYRYF